MNYYCTLDEARREIKASSDLINNNRLLSFIRIVSRRIDKIMTGQSNLPYFMPRIETYPVLIDSRRVSSVENSLLLKGLPPLLAITSVSADGTDITSVVEGYPRGEPYITKLRITSSGQSWYAYACHTPDPAYAEITGIWGYHSDYENAWLQVDALAAQQDASTGSFTVADVDGDDPYGITPRVSPGALVKIGDEYELVTDTDTGTNAVTATRHQNGSTADIHAISAPVYVWQVEEPIKRVTARQAGLLIARQGAYQVETLDGVGVVTYPQDLLTELKSVLQEYINE